MSIRDDCVGIRENGGANPHYFQAGCFEYAGMVYERNQQAMESESGEVYVSSIADSYVEYWEFNVKNMAAANTTIDAQTIHGHNALMTFLLGTAEFRETIIEVKKAGLDYTNSANWVDVRYWSGDIRVKEPTKDNFFIRILFRKEVS